MGRCCFFGNYMKSLWNNLDFGWNVEARRESLDEERCILERTKLNNQRERTLTNEIVKENLSLKLAKKYTL
jgi:hypothetical protein